MRSSGEDKVVRLRERIVSNSDHRTFYGRDNYRKAQLVTMQRMTNCELPSPTWQVWQLPTPKAREIAQKRGWETYKSQRTTTICSEIFSVYGRGAVTYKISICCLSRPAQWHQSTYQCGWGHPRWRGTVMKWDAEGGRISLLQKRALTGY